MVASTFDTALRGMTRRIVLAYATVAILFLTAGLALTALDKRGWDERLLVLAPRHYQAQDAEPLKKKIRDALAIFPGTLAKIGVAFLGVAVVGGAVRRFEVRHDESEPTTTGHTSQPAMPTQTWTARP